MNEAVSVPEDKLAQFCRRHNIERLSIFGSVLHGDFGPGSDLDILVEFLPGHTPGFFRFFEIQQQLSKIFDGRKVDLQTPQDLSRYFRDKVLEEAQVKYVHR